MSFNVVMFYVFSAIILIFSLLTITSRRILRAAVYLLFVLIATAGIYFLLEYQFMAAVQLTLYAGGIVVLIIFSILLTHHISHLFEKPELTKLLMGSGVAVVGSFVTIYTILTYPFPEIVTTTPLPATMENIGTQLLGLLPHAIPRSILSLGSGKSCIDTVRVASSRGSPACWTHPHGCQLSIAAFALSLDVR